MIFSTNDISAQTITGTTISGDTIILSGTNLTTTFSTKENKSEKGVANGYASLDSSVKIPNAQISQSSVTQYNSTLDHNLLQNIGINTHAQIDSHIAELSIHRGLSDTAITTTNLWSASKINSELSLISEGYFGKADVAVVTEGLGDISLSGTPIIHGYQTLTGDSIGVTNQTNSANNGIYEIPSSGGTWIRREDFDGTPDGEVKAGTFFFVSDNDTSFKKYRFIVLGSGIVNVGADNIDFTNRKPVDFGTVAGTATEGNDPRVPTQDENDALQGTTGTPSNANRYVTNSDTRLNQATTSNRGTVTLSSITIAEEKTSTTTALTPASVINFPLKRTSAITGDGVTTSFVITHNIGTRDILVQVYENQAPFQQVVVDVEYTNINSITINFILAPAIGVNYRVVIIG